MRLLLRARAAVHERPGTDQLLGALRHRPDDALNLPLELELEAESPEVIQRLVMDNGEVIVGNGRVVPGAPLSVATIDFLARGGDPSKALPSPYWV